MLGELLDKYTVGIPLRYFLLDLLLIILILLILLGYFRSKK